MKLLKSLTLIACGSFFLLNSCKKDNTGTTYVPPTPYDSFKLVGDWKLQYLYNREFVNGVMMKNDYVDYMKRNISLRLGKKDSLVMTIDDSTYYGSYSFFTNIIYTNPQSFQNFSFDSGTFTLETSRIWIEKEMKVTTDGMGRVHRFSTQYFLSK
ncbi:MAG: hypothetical protein WC716_10855 [Chitinophagaceae bacterium]|jgi:hypothetical protein